MEISAISTMLPDKAVAKLLAALAIDPQTSPGCSMKRVLALDEAIGWIKRTYPKLFKD